MESRVISINVGIPRQVQWRGRSVSTGIFKEPVPGPVRVGQLTMEGDRQADLTVHGGADKAVYAYAAEHYAFWRDALANPDIPYGMFGENLTVAGGFVEDRVFVGDRLRIGSAELMAVQPRLPCFKLGIRFGTQSIVRRFAASARFGVYFRVIREGVIALNDVVEYAGGSAVRLSIRELGSILLGRERDRRLIENGLDVPELPARTRAALREILETL